MPELVETRTAKTARSQVPTIDSRQEIHSSCVHLYKALLETCVKDAFARVEEVSTCITQYKSIDEYHKDKIKNRLNIVYGMHNKPAQPADATTTKTSRSKRLRTRQKAKKPNENTKTVIRYSGDHNERIKARIWDEKRLQGNSRHMARGRVILREIP